MILISIFACRHSSPASAEDPPSPKVLPESICDDPGVVFCNGFEDENLSAWDDYDGNPAPDNLVISDPGPFKTEGNHVMRFRVSDGRNGTDLVKVLPEKYDKLYARWYAYWEPGYDFNAANHGSGLFAGDRSYLGQSDRRPDGSDFATAWFEPDARNGGRPFLYTYYRGMYMDCSDPNGACWGDHFPCFIGPNYCTNPLHSPKEGKLPPPLTTGKWYCIEIMMDMGTPANAAPEADGVLNFWIDGAEYGPWNNMWFRTTAELKLNILYLSLFHHGQHSKEGVLFDNVVISTNPIGIAK